MQKRILVWLILLLCFVQMPSFADDAEKKTDNSETKTIPKKQDLQHFDKINLSGVGNLYIKQTDQENFTMEADEALLPLIKVSVKDKTLYIDLADASSHLKANIKYYLNIKTVNSIIASGLTHIFIPNGLQTDALKLSISGFGSEAHININVKQLTAKVDGGAKVEASGVAGAQMVEIHGAGEFDGTKLAGDIATVSIDGSSIAKTNISDKLSVDISGDAELKYCAKPDITQKISGNGRISRLESGC
ncbi:MAG TPA: head GIN domain-containing protein [Gammaproteobacteria bacterium]|nr:head GIN domain-containing protein [Gammaproteobacteria bacterium]HRA43042.1 head GIN domain-containing protein [Gammaproteobacteria bacterium]